MSDIEYKITYKHIKKGVKGITNALLLELINNPGKVYNTRNAEWYSEQIEPPFIIFRIMRRCVKCENTFHSYAIFIDELGIDEEVIIKCDEVKL